MLYYNIDRNLEYVLSKDKRYNRENLIKLIKEEFQKSDVELLELKEKEKSQFDLFVKYNGKIYLFVTFIKNVTGAGWKDKPLIKRVQVSNIKNEIPDSLIYKSETAYNLIMGYYNYDGNPIIVCWDAYRYVNHDTVRSCYVSVDSLKIGYQRKYYEGVSSGQKIWVFIGEKLGTFLENYIIYNESVDRRKK